MVAFETIKPTVKIDEAGLSDLVADFEFDFDAYYDMVRNAGLGRDQISALTLDYVSDQTRSALGKTLLGKYNRDKRTATISISEHVDNIMQNFMHVPYVQKGHPLSRLVNDTTVHETGHHVEHEVGDAEQYGNMVNRRVAAVLAGHVVTGVTAIATSSPSLGVALLTSASVTTGLACRSISRFEKSDPRERPNEIFAYKFEDSNRKEYQITTLRLSDDILYDTSRWR